MRRYAKAILIGAGVALGVTLLALAPFWIAPGSEFWHRMSSWPDACTRVFGWIIGIFGFAGIHIAEFFHKRHEHFGCRMIHLDWVVEWSLLVNTALGAIIGAIIVKAGETLSRTNH